MLPPSNSLLSLSLCSQCTHELQKHRSAVEQTRIPIYLYRAGGQAGRQAFFFQGTFREFWSSHLERSKSDAQKERQEMLLWQMSSTQWACPRPLAFALIPCTLPQSAKASVVVGCCTIKTFNLSLSGGRARKVAEKAGGHLLSSDRLWHE